MRLCSIRRWFLIALYSVAGIACRPSENAPRLSRRFVDLRPEWRKHLQDRYVAWRGAKGISVLGMRAGGGALAFAQRNPSAAFLVYLGDQEARLAGGRWESAVPLSLAASTDVIGMTSKGEALHLLAASGRVVRVNIGGLRDQVATLNTRTAMSACVDADSTIYYVDANSIGVVLSPSTPHEVNRSALPVRFATASSKAWQHTHFGGADDAPCVLYNPSPARSSSYRATPCTTWPHSSSSHPRFPGIKGSG
jgi:hypothetical protein